MVMEAKESMLKALMVFSYQIVWRKTVIQKTVFHSKNIQNSTWRQVNTHTFPIMPHSQNSSAVTTPAGVLCPWSDRKTYRQGRRDTQCSRDSAGCFVSQWGERLSLSDIQGRQKRERESTLTVAWFNPSKINKTLSLKPCNQSVEIQQCTTQKLEEINNILTI